MKWNNCLQGKKEIQFGVVFLGKVSSLEIGKNHRKKVLETEIKQNLH